MLYGNWRLKWVVSCYKQRLHIQKYLSHCGYGGLSSHSLTIFGNTFEGSEAHFFHFHFMFVQLSIVWSIDFLCSSLFAVCRRQYVYGNVFYMPKPFVAHCSSIIWHLHYSVFFLLHPTTHKFFLSSIVSSICHHFRIFLETFALLFLFLSFPISQYLYWASSSRLYYDIFLWVRWRKDLNHCNRYYSMYSTDAAELPTSNIFANSLFFDSTG